MAEEQHTQQTFSEADDAQATPERADDASGVVPASTPDAEMTPPPTEAPQDVSVQAEHADDPIAWSDAQPSRAASEENEHATEPEAEATSQPPPPPSVWQTLRRWLWQSPGERREEETRRLQTLNKAIDRHPNSPANYLLRAELLMNQGNYTLAEADLQRALALSAEQSVNNDWGVVAQATLDRAQQGLHRLHKRYTPAKSAADAQHHHEEKS